VTPADALAGLVNFRLRGVDAAALGAQGVTIRAIPETNTLRASCAFFNTQAEIDRLLAALAGQGL